MLKLTLAEDSLDENRLTGTETSPKEIVADPMDLAAMNDSVGVGGLIYRQNRTAARRGCSMNRAIVCSLL
jgi:hypothetical protein